MLGYLFAIYFSLALSPFWFLLHIQLPTNQERTGPPPYSLRPISGTEQISLPDLCVVMGSAQREVKVLGSDNILKGQTFPSDPSFVSLYKMGFLNGLKFSIWEPQLTVAPTAAKFQPHRENGL